MPITSRLREIVFVRDVWAIWETSRERRDGMTFKRYMSLRLVRKPPCMVEKLSPSDSVKCSGRWTLEHVKCQLMMGKKAWDSETEPCPQCGRTGRYHLIILCEEHNVWHPPSKALRQLAREYLAEAGDYEARLIEACSGDEPSLEGGWNLRDQARR